MVLGILLAVLAIVGVMVMVALVAVFMPKKATPVPPATIARPVDPYGVLSSPGVALIQAYEAAGKISAGRIIEEKLGDHKASEVIHSMTAGLSSTSVPPSPPRPN